MAELFVVCGEERLRSRRSEEDSRDGLCTIERRVDKAVLLGDYMAYTSDGACV